MQIIIDAAKHSRLLALTPQSICNDKIKQCNISKKNLHYI